MRKERLEYCLFRACYLLKLNASVQILRLGLPYSSRFSAKQNGLPFCAGRHPLSFCRVCEKVVLVNKTEKSAVSTFIVLLFSLALCSHWKHLTDLIRFQYSRHRCSPCLNILRRILRISPSHHQETRWVSRRNHKVRLLLKCQSSLLFRSIWVWRAGENLQSPTRPTQVQERR